MDSPTVECQHLRRSFFTDVFDRCGILPQMVTILIDDLKIREWPEVNHG